MFNLTKKQQEIVDSNARIKLIMGGMRSGKTTILLASIERAMRELNSRGTQVLIHVPNIKYAQMMIRDIPHRISRDILIDIDKKNLIISTTYGVIEIETFNKEEYGFEQIGKEISRNLFAIGKELLKFDIIATDNSTSLSLFDLIINTPCNDIIAAGHCPEDKNNAFYKTWLSAYYNDIPDTKAFKLTTWNNPVMDDKREYEPRLIKSMGLEKYVRNYYATFIK